LLILAFFLTWYIPVLLFAPLVAIVGVSIPALVIIIITALWIQLYYEKIFYKLTETEMEWKRGVWFRRTGIVPYNRITNIDITQGPLSRILGIASLRIQTAGYSAPSQGSFGKFAEIRIEGMKQFEELRELIMQFVRSRKPVAVETYQDEGRTDTRMLDELRKIRELLERSSKK